MKTKRWVKSVINGYKLMQLLHYMGQYCNLYAHAVS